MPKINRKRKSRTAPVRRQPCLDVTDFPGQWVAVHPRTYKIIGHGASLEEARQSTPNLARLEPVLYYVPESNAFFVGRAQ